MRAARAPLIASATGSGRWTQSASGPSGRRPSTRTGWPGLPTTVEFGGTSWMTTEFAPIFAPWPIVIGPSSFAPGADRHVVLHRRVALAGGEAGAAERDALVERDVVADLRRLADHDAVAVVDEEPVADLRGRVDLDAGERAGDERERPRAPRARPPRAARARRDGSAARARRARPRAPRRRDTARGGVALVRGGHVAAQLARDARQGSEAEHASYTVAVRWRRLPDPPRARRVRSRSLAALARRAARAGRAHGAASRTCRTPMRPTPRRGAASCWPRSAHLAGDERVVICHSLSCIAVAALTARSWSGRSTAWRSSRRPRWARGSRRSSRSSRSPRPRTTSRAAAGHTRLVCADDDPYCPEGAAALYGGPLDLPDRSASGRAAT